MQLLVISSRVTANDLYTSCMKVGTGGNLGLSREYHKKLFGPLFYTWWNCPLIFQGYCVSGKFFQFKN